MEELERGCVPWHKPWKSPDGVRVPMNYASKKPYRGVNTFLLAVSRFKAGYDSNYWLTFKQIQALGGNVKGQQFDSFPYTKVFVRVVGSAQEAFRIKKGDRAVSRIHADLFDNKTLTAIKDCLTHSDVSCLLKHGERPPRFGVAVDSLLPTWKGQAGRVEGTRENVLGYARKRSFVSPRGSFLARHSTVLPAPAGPLYFLLRFTLYLFS
jgi:hypothetical protein